MLLWWTPLRKLRRTITLPDAEQDYLGKPGEFRVHVEIYFTDTYPKPTDTAGSLGDFWSDFQVH